MKSGVGSLEGVLAKFSGRIAKLPVEFQAIFFEDLTVASTITGITAFSFDIGVVGSSG